VFDDYVFIVVRMFRYNDKAAAAEEAQASLILARTTC